MDIAGTRTLYSVLASHAAQQPDSPWLAYEAPGGQVTHWTFFEFLQSVHQVANLLQELGISEGDVVNIHLANHPAYPQLILAASYLGAVVMPSNPKGTVDELSYLLSHSESRLIFTDTDSLENVKAASNLPIIICNTGTPLPAGLPVYETELARQKTEPPAQKGTATSTVQLLYTSGTTSRPKGVMLTNTNFIYGSEVLRASTGLRKDDHHLIPLPLFHAAAQCHALWPSLMVGCRVTILSKFSASRFFIQAAAHDATMAALFSAPLRMILNQPERPTDNKHRMRNITFAQGLSEEAYEEWHRRFNAPLQHLWGMTETCSLPIMSPLTGARNLAAMGRPVLGYEVRVTDEAGKEVALGESGQICIRGIPGRSLMAGYLKNPEATEITIRHEADGTWLYTGDMARQDENDFLYFMHRGNDLIKRAGENISGVEIESVIATLENVIDVCVVGLPDPIRDQEVVAVIVAKADTNLTADIVQQHCASRLTGYKIPTRVEFLDVLPRTSVGKIQKNIVCEILMKKDRSK